MLVKSRNMWPNTAVSCIMYLKVASEFFRAFYKTHKEIRTYLHMWKLKQENKNSNKNLGQN